MNPVEAVARALANLRGCFGEVDDIWPDYEPDARAALTALRDNGVTGQMWDAWASTEGPDAEFRAMLDAALEEND